MKVGRQILALALLALIAAQSTAAARGARQPVEAREPAVNLHATSLVGRTGKATVANNGRRTRVQLRRNERLTEIAEAGQGWVAAGLRAGAKAFVPKSTSGEELIESTLSNR